MCDIDNWVYIFLVCVCFKIMKKIIPTFKFATNKLYFSPFIVVIFSGVGKLLLNSQSSVLSGRQAIRKPNWAIGSLIQFL